MKQSSALYTWIPEDRMFLRGTSKFAHMQITIYVQYRRSEHGSWAHRKHQSSVRDNWRAGPWSVCNSRVRSLICLQFQSNSSTHASELLALAALKGLQNTAAHLHWLSKCCSQFCTVFIQCQMCYTYKHLLYCLGFIPQFLILDAPMTGWRW